MTKSILPLYSEFAEIFERYEINNWEVKDFWAKMGLEEVSNAKHLKKMLHAGLKILVRYECLMVDQAKSKNVLHVYT